LHALVDETARFVVRSGPTGSVRSNGYRRFRRLTGNCSSGRPLAMAPLSNWDSITVIMPELRRSHKDKGGEIFHLLRRPDRRRKKT
jgi:hypothetical protein